MGDVTLLPCPFCGEARVSDPNGAFGLTLHMTDVWWVACQTCGCQSQARKTIKQARAAWNRRALTPAQQAAEEMVEALREAKEFIENQQLPDAEWSRVLDVVVAALAKAGKP